MIWSWQFLPSTKHKPATGTSCPPPSPAWPVHPAALGLGAGNALLTQALAWAKSHGARRVRLGVTHADSPAMRLYRVHGFRPVGDMEPLREGSDLMAQAIELVCGEPVAGLSLGMGSGGCFRL